jgi:hypothetical protein
MISSKKNERAQIVYLNSTTHLPPIIPQNTHEQYKILRPFFPTFQQKK